MPVSVLTSSPKGAPTLHPDSSSNHDTAKKASLFGEDGFSFGDIIDIINPLQHIPVIGTLYRKITGDTIAPAMQVAGGALFGGPIGAAVSLVTTSIQSHFEQDSTDPDSPYRDTETVQVADQATPPSPTNINLTDYTKTTEQDGLTTNSLSLQLRTEPIRTKPVYQPADGIVNIAYLETKNYDNRVSATEKNKVDIVIGSGRGTI